MEPVAYNAVPRLNAQSCVRNRRVVRGTATTTYYEPHPDFVKVIDRIVQVRDGRGALIVELVTSKSDRTVQGRFALHEHWQLSAFTDLQRAIQAFSCRFR